MWDPALWTKPALSLLLMHFSFFPIFLWELEPSTDLKSNKTRNSFSLLNFFFFLPKQGRKVICYLQQHLKHNLRIYFLSWRLCTPQEGTEILLKQKSGDLTFSMVWLLYLLFLYPPLRGRFPVAVVAMVLSRTRCLLQSQNCVCGCTVNNYLFWQVRLVYSELI